MAVDHGKHEHLPASGSLGATCHPSSSQPKHIFFFRACEFRYNTTDSASHLPVNLSIRRQNWILPVLIPNVHTAPLPPLRTHPAFLSQTPLLKGSDISAHYLQARYIYSAAMFFTPTSIHPHAEQRSTQLKTPRLIPLWHQRPNSV